MGKNSCDKSCEFLFAAWPSMQSSLVGFPVMLSCGQHPVEPVEWTYQQMQQSPVDSAVKVIVISGSVVGDHAKRFSVHQSILIINVVEMSDGGYYNCTDATGEIITIHLSVLGKSCSE